MLAEARTWADGTRMAHRSREAMAAGGGLLAGTAGALLYEYEIGAGGPGGSRTPTAFAAVLQTVGLATCPLPTHPTRPARGRTACRRNGTRGPVRRSGTWPL